MSKLPARPPFDPETGTLPDDIPPVHVLEAAQAQDRKEAEDLLSGFNRPGREPKRPLEERDFVDYYARKKGAPATPRDAFRIPAAPNAAPTQQKARWDERPSREMPPWAGWVGIGALMIAVGGIVAFVATSEPPSKRPAVPTTGAATPFASATSANLTGSRDAVPPPPPVSAVADPTAITTTPITVSPSAPSAATRTKRDRHSAASSAIEPAGTAAPARTTPLPAAAAGTTGPTRDDLVRDM